MGQQANTGNAGLWNAGSCDGTELRFVCSNTLTFGAVADAEQDTLTLTDMAGAACFDLCCSAVAAHEAALVADLKGRYDARDAHCADRDAKRERAEAIAARWPAIADELTVLGRIS